MQTWIIQDCSELDVLRLKNVDSTERTLLALREPPPDTLGMEDVETARKHHRKVVWTEAHDANLFTSSALPEWT